jgi:hypothetical protein
MFPGIQGQSPGMKVQYDGRGWYAFGGFKTAQINEIERTFVSNDNNNVQQINVAETNYAFLGGAGADVLPQLHFDVSGGYFQQGRFDTPDLIPPPNVDQSPPRVFTFGGSARIVIHDGMPAPQSVDFLLYRNDPSAPMLMFQQEKYSKDQFAYAIALEGTRLEQNLHDGSSDAAGNVRTGATTLQGANAAALSAQFKIGDARVGVFGIYRDLAYINRNQPGNPPFEAFTQADHLQSEIFLAGTLAYYIESLHMMPGIGGGIQLPAADTATLNIGNVEVDRATIFRKQGDIAILPEGAGRRAIIQTRVSLRWDLSTAFAAIGWLQLIHDPNQNQLESDPTTQAVLIRTFQSPNFFGFGMTLQARY